MSKLIQFIDNLKTKIYSVPYYPVGSVFITVENTNPSKWFGGTWVSFGSGRTLVGVDISQTEFSTVQKTGGEKTHKLTVDESPSHTHAYLVSYVYTGNKGYYEANELTNPLPNDGKITAAPANAWNNAPNKYSAIKETGGGKAHNNLQPYITVYFWRKTAM